MTEDITIAASLAEEKALALRPWENVSPAEVIESVAISGDLSKLTAEQRVAYYIRTCESLGLNPYTKPFDYIWLGKDQERKLVLYAKKDATDQIRAAKRISITDLTPATVPEGLFGIVAHARTPDGREDTATGIVSIASWEGKALKGDMLANALMKAETKAKRRVTLSLAGLGIIDESEVASIPDGEVVVVDDQGNIKVEEPKQLSDVIAQRVEAIKTLQEAGVEISVIQPESAPEPEHVSAPEALTPQTAEPEVVSPSTPTPVAAPSASYSLEQFASDMAQFPRDALREKARELYPEASGFRQLTVAQLQALADAMVQDAEGLGAVVDSVGESPSTEEPAFMAEPTVEASATKAVRCGDPSPFSDVTCGLLPDHKGRHLAGTNESW